MSVLMSLQEGKGSRRTVCTDEPARLEGLKTSTLKDLGHVLDNGRRFALGSLSDSESWS